MDGLGAIPLSGTAFLEQDAQVKSLWSDMTPLENNTSLTNALAAIRSPASRGTSISELNSPLASGLQLNQTSDIAEADNGASVETSEAGLSSLNVSSQPTIVRSAATSNSGHKADAASDSLTGTDKSAPLVGALAATQDIMVDFQPDTAAVPAGYVKDVGQAYSDARSFGWVRQDSLSSGTHTPLDITSNARDRNQAAIDPKLNTLLHMQYPSDIYNPTAVKVPAAWEYALPNGTYNVTVNVGDPSYFNSQHTINVEGVNAINRFHSGFKQTFKQATVKATVTDGRLTIDAIGGSNTKINYLEIKSTASDMSSIPPNKPSQISSMLGGGNFYPEDSTQEAASKYDVLNTVGAKMARFAVHSDMYYADDAPSPSNLDAQINLAYQKGIKPVILFEFYLNKYGFQGPLGSYDKWYKIGQAFAERFRPNGAWAQSKGISNWGITTYTAINEPDGFNNIPKVDYKNALEGLADGVHSVDASLNVSPGGFRAANAGQDYTLSGYGPAIAPLYNSGKLDSMDLHTFYNVQWAPLEGTYSRSAQDNFDKVKKASGITADINFYTTEFNYANSELVTEAQAAKGFLTGIWDNLGVVKSNGTTPATQFAFPWNIFSHTSSDLTYGLDTDLGPAWVPTARGKVLQMVLEKTKGMSFESLDPKNKGEYVLSGNGKKMWVWQDRPHWTNHPGTSYAVKAIPRTAEKLEVYGWNGLRRTINLSGQTSYTITGLPGNETYMFLAS